MATPGVPSYYYEVTDSDGRPSIRILNRRLIIRVGRIFMPLPPCQHLEGRGQVHWRTLKFEEAKQFADANELPETVKICSSHDEVIDDLEVDAVYVPVPVGQHSRWGTVVAERKKLDLVELDLEKKLDLAVAERKKLDLVELDLGKKLDLAVAERKKLDLGQQLDLVELDLGKKLDLAVAERKKLDLGQQLDLVELEKILEACERNGVQFMDTTMWLHHTRTKKMKEFISDPKLFGKIGLVISF
ncbi:Uncharacterized oxidoreductase At4g09670 [Linum perenne]